jgi:hypothetical protein
LHDAYQKFYDRYGLDIRTDFDGNPIPADSIDIGAYQYV